MQPRIPPVEPPYEPEVERELTQLAAEVDRASIEGLAEQVRLGLERVEPLRCLVDGDLPSGRYRAADLVPTGAGR